MAEASCIAKLESSRVRATSVWFAPAAALALDAGGRGAHLDRSRDRWVKAVQMESLGQAKQACSQFRYHHLIVDRSHSPHRSNAPIPLHHTLTDRRTPVKSQAKQGGPWSASLATSRLRRARYVCVLFVWPAGPSLAGHPSFPSHAQPPPRRMYDPHTHSTCRSRRAAATWRTRATTNSLSSRTAARASSCSSRCGRSGLVDAFRPVQCN